MVRRKIRDADEARACLAEADASGLTRAAWAREHAVDARSLNAWRLNLERRDRRFGELHLVELVPTAPMPSARYRIHHREFVVELDERFDDAVVARLLAVVATC